MLYRMEFDSDLRDLPPRLPKHLGNLPFQLRSGQDRHGVRYVDSEVDVYQRSSPLRSQLLDREYARTLRDSSGIAIRDAAMKQRVQCMQEFILRIFRYPSVGQFSKCPSKQCHTLPKNDRRYEQAFGQTLHERSSDFHYGSPTYLQVGRVAGQGRWRTPE